MGRLTLTVVVMALVAGCTTGDLAPTASSNATTSTSSASAPDTSGAEPPASTGSPGPSSPTTAPLGACPEPMPGADPTGPSVTAEVVADDGVLVEAVVYPHPDHEGTPWSHWGLGAITPGGHFVSAIGDHLGRDGNSWLYDFDPVSGTLTQVVDVQSVIGHRTGAWGYGKVHGRIVVDACGIAYLATYWGTRRDIEFGESYAGDHLLRWDTRTDHVETLGVPVPGHGVPSLNADFARGLLFGEAVDPTSDPDAGLFFTYDLSTGAHTTFPIDGHVGFRDVAVTHRGHACVAVGGGMLGCYDPTIDEVYTTGRLPGDWLRASTVPGPDGTVYGATREPDAFFALRPDGTAHALGDARGYTAAMALDPSGERFFYVPDAHGGAWENGAPLIAVDTATGEQTLVVELGPGVEDAFGLFLGGTYSVATDGERVFVAMNAGRGEASFGEVVLVVVHLP